MLLTPPRGVALRLAGELDWRVFVASAGVCVGSTLLFALVPAMLTSNLALSTKASSERTRATTDGLSAPPA